jgi:hypothetical protein
LLPAGKSTEGTVIATAGINIEYCLLSVRQRITGKLKLLMEQTEKAD